MPVIRLNINDDEEFTSCEYCKRHVQPYNNTSLSTTAIHNVYTKTLIQYHHLNCQKCGLYIELHPKKPSDESLIFLCPNHIPHKHVLCYDCGILYDLKPDKKATDVLSQLQYNTITPSSHSQIQTQPTNNNVLASNTAFPASMGVTNATFGIAELMNEMSSTNPSETTDSDGLPLFLGTFLAFFVWFGIYLTSPELFRLSGCFVWFTIFYILTSIFFTENELVQKAVFSLFSFSPIFAAIYVFQRTKMLSTNNMSPDIPITVQFFCIFGCIVYLSYYFSPLQMYLFLRNDFMELTFIQQLVSLFIAISLGSFLMILCKNCNFLTNAWTTNEKILDLDESHDKINENVMTDLKTTPEITENKQVVKSKRKRRKRKKKRALRAD